LLQYRKDHVHLLLHLLKAESLVFRKTFLFQGNSFSCSPLADSVHILSSKLAMEFKLEIYILSFWLAIGLSYITWLYCGLTSHQAGHSPERQVDYLCSSDSTPRICRCNG
jgi:hypothetical protein